MGSKTKFIDKTIFKRGEVQKARETRTNERTRDPRIDPKPKQIVATQRKINDGKEVSKNLRNNFLGTFIRGKQDKDDVPSVESMPKFTSMREIPYDS